ncbi:MAG: tRNA-splicing endonuclease [Candidatus Syntrophoarchaeum sp. GoM_oil]|nr:MAG: tRNA-splicing endonuclease [Candidatus Syntrophoarchaeum sp. GoM_oil]
MNFSKDETVRADLTEKSVIWDGIKFSLEEAGYLLERGRFTLFDGEDQLDLRTFLKRASHILPNFELRFLVYKNIRDRGYYLKPGPLDFRVYPRGVKSGEGESRYIVHVLSEREPIAPAMILKDITLSENLKKRLLYAVVDEEGDITYYEIKHRDLRGSSLSLEVLNGAIGDMLEERVIIWDAKILKQLNERWWFGRLIDENRRLQLSFVESAYLIDRGSLTVLDSEGEVLDFDGFIGASSSLEPNFFKKYVTYRDLRDRGMVVKTGFKFGSHFRVYEGIPSREAYHSRYLVHVLMDDRKLKLPEISRAVRLAHGVKKQMVFAVPGDDQVEYFEVGWVRL